MMKEESEYYQDRWDMIKIEEAVQSMNDQEFEIFKEKVEKMVASY